MIPVHAMVSASDMTCPSASNLTLLSGITTLSSETLAVGMEVDHMDILSNDAAFMSNFMNQLPGEFIAIDNPLLCPIIPIPPEPESTCQIVFGAASDDEEERESRSKCRV